MVYCADKETIINRDNTSITDAKLETKFITHKSIEPLGFSTKTYKK